MVNYSRELRMGVDIRRKKNRKSNRVYRKNKESTEGSGGSIEESTGRDEVTSR